MNNSHKMRVCLIYNGASHYRAAIFKMIDEEYDCDWYFARERGGIRQLPLSYFKNAHYLDAKPIKGALCHQPGEAKLLLSKDYDVFFILGEIINVSCWWGMFLHNLFNRKRHVYFWSHGVLRMHNQPRRLFDKLFFKLPYGTFVYGNRSRQNLIDLGIREDRLFVIHNSIDHEKQIQLRKNLSISNIYVNHFNNHNPVVIFVGRLIKDKQLGMILDAAKIAVEKNRPFNVVLIGDGIDKEYLEYQAKSFSLQCYVWFYGACYEEEKLSVLLYNADICVSPGPIGLTAIHALTYGCPVITNNDFGHHGPEHEAIQKGVTGDFFKYNNVNSLEECIFEWLNAMKGRRDTVRRACFREIDTQWTPSFQMDVIKQHLKKNDSNNKYL